MTPLAWGSSLSSQYQRFYPKPSNFSSSPSSLSLLITLTICIIDPKILSFDSIFTIAWWCQKFRFASGCMFVIRTGIWSEGSQCQIWENTKTLCKLSEELTKTLCKTFIPKDHISKAVDLYRYLHYKQLETVGLINIFTNLQYHGASCIWSIFCNGPWALDTHLQMAEKVSYRG